jgi:hypothetical protein
VSCYIKPKGALYCTLRQGAIREPLFRYCEAMGRVGRHSRALRWLTVVSMFLGVLSTMSYALGGANIVRMKNPALGAWFDAYQFYLMEGAATALGLLVAIGLARRLINQPENRARCTVWSGILAVLAFSPLVHVCATTARLGPDVLGVVLEDRISSVASYQIRIQLDKLLIAGVYFLKTACLALVAGFGLVAIVVAVLFVAGGAADLEAASSGTRGQP